MADPKYFPPQFLESGVGPDNNLFDKTAVYVHHLLTNKIVKFKSFITNFNDDHQTLWNEESVYGRMDNIATFQNTKRIITISFDVPSYSKEEAIVNLRNMNMLKQFLYPLYAGSSVVGANALALSSSPLVRVKYANLIVNNKNPSLGLLCLMKSMTYAPVLDVGSYGSDGKEAYNVIAKQYNVTLNLGVLHEHRTGWTKSGSDYFFADDSSYQNKYPYLINDAPAAEPTETERPTPNSDDPIPQEPPENTITPVKKDNGMVGSDPDAHIARSKAGSTSSDLIAVNSSAVLKGVA